MPSSAKTWAIAWEISASSAEASRERVTTVTWVPRRANSWACSSPTGPPPSTSREPGRCSRAIADVEVR
jgi:hypothetical protein